MANTSRYTLLLLLIAAPSLCRQQQGQEHTILDEKAMGFEDTPACVEKNKQLVNIIELLRQLQIMVLGKDMLVDKVLADIVRRLFHEPYGIQLLASILPPLRAAIKQLAELPNTEFVEPHYLAIKDAVVATINSLYKSTAGSEMDEAQIEVIKSVLTDLP